MSKTGYTCKEAIQKWEETSGDKAATATKVSLISMFIRKMESNVLNTLTNCEHLGLSTNCIDKIAPLSLKKLKILSLGRNNLRKIEKLEELAPTLEQLWLSYNQIDKLQGLNNFNNLQILYMSNNKIKSFEEIDRLKDLPRLQELLLLGNPLYEGLTTQECRAEVLKRLPKLKKLDGTLVTEAEVEAATSVDGNE